MFSKIGGLHCTSFHHVSDCTLREQDLNLLLDLVKKSITIKTEYYNSVVSEKIDQVEQQGANYVVFKGLSD